MEPESHRDRHQLFLEHSAVIVTVIDEDGWITYQSPGTSHTIGYEPDTLVGDRVFEYIHPDDLSQMRSALDALFNRSVEQRTIEYRFEHAQDGWVWLQTLNARYPDHPDIDGVVLNSVEVTELKHQEAHHEAILESINDGVVMIQDGDITYVNPRMVELTGFSPEEAIGEPFLTFVAEDHQDLVKRRYQQRLEGAVSREEYQIEIVTKFGEHIPVELSVSVIDFNGDQGVIAVIRDIRNRFARERQLRVLDRVLRHNLRNAMTTIQGNAETIKRESEVVDREAQNIIAEIGSLLETVDKEREIVDILCDPVDPTEVDMSELCRRKADSLEAAHPSITVTRDIQPGVTAKATKRIGRAIEELLDNAIEHNDQSVKHVGLSVEYNRDRVTIAIEDNGPGIPAEEIDVLTAENEPDQLYHGSGLGLWLINWIVRQSSGILELEPNEPRGSVVSIELDRVK